MTPLIYARYALAEYARGRFAYNNGDPVSFDDQGYTIKNFFSKLNEALPYLNFPINNNASFYFRCVDGLGYLEAPETYQPSGFYLPSVVTAMQTPSETFPDIGNRYLGQLSDADQINDIKANTSISDVYSFPYSLWPSSWVKISDNYKQFYEIVTSYIYRGMPMFSGFEGTIISGTRRDIIRDAAGVVTSDTTTPQTSFRGVWQIKVDSNLIVREESIRTALEHFNIVTDRADNYESSLHYYDVLLNVITGTKPDETLYNSESHDVLAGDIQHTIKDPRDFLTGGLEAGEYETTLVNNGSFPTILSKIKKYTMQELYEALNIPSDQY